MSFGTWCRDSLNEIKYYLTFSAVFIDPLSRPEKMKFLTYTLPLIYLFCALPEVVSGQRHPEQRQGLKTLVLVHQDQMRARRKQMMHRPSSYVAKSFLRSLHGSTHAAAASSSSLLSDYVQLQGARRSLMLVSTSALQQNKVDCLPCLQGSFSSAELNGRKQCISCPLGMYQPHNTSSECLACQPGYYSGSLIGATQCKICPSGHYADEPMMPECKPCKEGFFVAREGSEKCLPCAR